MYKIAALQLTARTLTILCPLNLVQSALETILKHPIPFTGWRKSFAKSNLSTRINSENNDHLNRIKSTVCMRVFVLAAICIVIDFVK